MRRRKTGKNEIPAESTGSLPDYSGRRLILLGPQPQYQSLRKALERLQPDGPVAVITAGWQEEETDARQLDPLMEALPDDSFNLNLFHRTEDLFAADSELIEMLRERQDELRLLRDVYRIRLEQTLEAARRVLKRPDSRIDLQPERESAIETVRLLDRQYFGRTREICNRWESRLDTSTRGEVKRHRREIHDLLDGASAIVISGGHAAIILNRLRIFGILESHQHLPIVAWSGGTMALADQIVFFHDSPPQGRGDAEVLRAGMSLFDQYLPLPDARHRLRLDDPVRVGLFSRRFETYQCVVFDEDTLLDREGGQWWASPEARSLTGEGQLAQVTT